MRAGNAKEIQMATLTHRIDVRLAGDELLPMKNIRGRRLRCLEGSVWITLDRDLRDIFLQAGECFVVDRDGMTLVHALAPARLRLDDAAAAPAAGWRGLLARLWRLLPARQPASLAGA
jgi:hypothetical protein